MAPKPRARVNGVGSKLSPGGKTKTIDFTIGGIQPRAEDEQAALLDGMLAEAEEEDSRVRNGGGSPHVRKMPASIKPTALASKYGVDVPSEDSDDDDDDFNIDDDVADDVEEIRDPNPTQGRHMDDRELGQLAAMAQENMQLRGELDERKSQVRKLGVMLEALEPAPGLDAEKLLDCMEGTDGAMDPRDVKIVQLAKKSRKLSVENNRLRDKSKLAEEKARAKELECRELQKQLELMASPAARAALMKKLVPGSSSPRASPKKEGVEEVNKRAEKELVEARGRVSKANEETRKLRVALHRELGLAEGEAIPDKILDEEQGGGWRGRSEKIVLLKCKVKELEGELEQHRGRKDPKQAAMEKVRDVDRLAREDLREMEEARRQATEQLSHEYHELSEKQEKTKMKLDAAKARTAGLENDNGKMRKQIKMLLDKATNDDALVDALRNELQSMRMELHNTKQHLEREKTGRQGFGEGPRMMVAGTRGLGQIANGSLNAKIETLPDPQSSMTTRNRTLLAQPLASPRPYDEMRGANDTTRNRTLMGIGTVGGTMERQGGSPRLDSNITRQSMDQLNDNLPPSRYRNQRSR